MSILNDITLEINKRLKNFCNKLKLITSQNIFLIIGNFF